MSDIYFSSDHHLGHANIIGYTGRPFKTIKEMDDALIENWNQKVKLGDTVYHIGDFALVRTPQEVMNYVRRLNGQIHLIYGNHDRFVKQKRPDNYGFAEITPYKEIRVGEQKIVLCHYAFKTWRGSHRGTWNLHGHSHGSLPRDFTQKQFDVGVDCWNYFPISYEEVAKEMEKHKFVPVDHHGEGDV
jgi:calcineurin-like phosphoesterase family protein